MYTQLIRNNEHIIEQIGESEMRRFLDLLAVQRNPDYLDFLVSLCECNGAPITSNQNVICKSLLNENGPYRNTLLTTRSVDGDSYEVCVRCLQ